MIVASDINQRGISTSDPAHTAPNSPLRKLNDFQSAICLISGRLPPDSLLKNLIRNQTCNVALVLQREQLWAFSLYFPKLVLFHESTLISLSYPYFLEAANERFSCREQFILPPLGAWSKPSSGPSGSFFPVLAEPWQVVCSRCSNTSSCVTETISWQLFLDDLEPFNVFGGGSCICALLLTSLSSAANTMAPHLVPGAVHWHLHNRCLVLALNPSDGRCTFPDIQIVWECVLLSQNTLLFWYSNVCIPDRDIFYAMGALRTYLQHTFYVFLIVALTVSVWKLIPLFCLLCLPNLPSPSCWFGWS